MKRIVVAALVVGLSAGCGGGARPAGETAPSASASVQVSGPKTGVPDRAAYLTYMRRVDRGLVVNEERAVRRGRSTCLDIKAGMAGQKLVQRVSARFSGGNATIDKAKAKRIIVAVKRWIC